MPTLRLSYLTVPVLVALAAALTLPSGTIAAKPVISHFGDSYSFTVLADQNPCGVDLLIEGEFRVVEHLFFDEAGNLVKVTANINDAWTESGPGGTVRGHASVSVTTTDFVEGDGFASWVDTFRGVPIKFSAPGVEVIVRDAGNVALARTVYFNNPDDPFDDTFEEEISFEHGPHPTLFGSALFNEDWIADYCAVVTG